MNKEYTNNNENNNTYKNMLNENLINKSRGCQLCKFIRFFSFIKKT